MKFDATTMHVKPEVAAQQKMVDDGSGEAEVGCGKDAGCIRGMRWETPWECRCCGARDAPALAAV